MLYCLTHANVLSQSGVPDRLRKRIGHYSTLKKALAARERAAAPEALEACEVLVGVDGWTEGFAPVYFHDHEFAALSP